MDLGIYACSWRPEGFGVPGAERRKKEKPQGRGREQSRDSRESRRLWDGGVRQSDLVLKGQGFQEEGREQTLAF